MSFSLDSCVPAPVCESKTYPMNSMDGIVSVDKYLGDSSTADWVYQGEPHEFNGNIILTMPPRSVGTVLASSTYMWYGSVKAKIKTSVGQGVVTAFILYSDVKDEIDYEFVGVDLNQAQTNYYFQGIPKYDQGGNSSVSSNTYENFHDYEIQWTPDAIRWLIDDEEVRVKEKSDTWNETANQWDFPQTPSRVQLSIWPGGADTNAKGTIDWAGGPIDWDSDYIKKNGYYFATFGEIEVKCFDASSPPGTNKGKSYWYTDARATNDTVEDGDRDTVIKSLSATGLDMDKGEDSSVSNKVPGGGSSGPGQNPGGASSDSGNAVDCSGSSFQQSCDPANDATGLKQTSGASIFAVVVALSALMWW